jgi:hypothetical protein
MMVSWSMNRSTSTRRPPARPPTRTHGRPSRVGTSGGARNADVLEHAADALDGGQPACGHVRPVDPDDAAVGAVADEQVEVGRATKVGAVARWMP